MTVFLFSGQGSQHEVWETTFFVSFKEVVVGEVVVKCIKRYP